MHEIMLGMETCQQMLTSSVLRRSMPEATGHDTSQPAHIVRSFDAALQALATCKEQVETVFLIGGGAIYAEALLHPQCEMVHLTEIQSEPECDTFFPALPSDEFRLWSRSQPLQSKDHAIVFKAYVRCAERTVSLLLPGSLPEMLRSALH